MPDSLDFPILPPQVATGNRSVVVERQDLRGLMQAMEEAPKADNVFDLFERDDWEALSWFLEPMPLKAGEKMFVAGSMDRSLYFTESGNYSLHFEDSNGKIRVTTAGAGIVLGESAFFAQTAHRANVQAIMEGHAWTLSMEAFGQLTEQHPKSALQVSLAAGRILARRALDARLRTLST